MIARSERYWQRRIKRMCRGFYEKPLRVEFGSSPEVTIHHGEGKVCFTAPTWEYLHNWVRKLTNPASRI